VSRSSQNAFNVALLNARVPLQWANGIGFRDQGLAENVTWIRDRFSTTRRVIFWAHDAHISRTPMQFSLGNPAGQFLAQTYGSDYFAIGTMFGTGSFLQWNAVRGVLTNQTVTLGPLGGDSHEAFLRQRGPQAFLLPLRGELPAWLTTPRVMNVSASGGPLATRQESLPALFDAVVYVETSTPMRLLP